MFCEFDAYLLFQKICDEKQHCIKSNMLAHLLLLMLLVVLEQCVVT